MWRRRLRKHRVGELNEGDCQSNNIQSILFDMACYSCAARCGSGCATNPLEFGTTSVKSAGFQPAGEASSTTPPKDAGLQTRTSRNLSLSQAAMTRVMHTRDHVTHA